MFVNKILMVVRMIFKPAKLFRYNLKRPINILLGNILTIAISLAAAGFILVKFYPYYGLKRLIVVTACAIIAGLICRKTVSYLYPKVSRFVAALFYAPAAIYDLCDDKLNNVSRKKTVTATTKKGPSIETGIMYFIEREERIQINHAKYLGSG